MRINKKGQLSVKRLQVMLIFLVVVAGSFVILLEPSLTGFVAYDTLAIEQEVSAVQNKSLLVITEDPSDVLPVSSIKVSGTIIGEGDAKVFLQTETGEKILIFSSKDIIPPQGLIGITGFAPNKKGEKKTPPGQAKKEEPPVLEPPFPEREPPVEEPPVQEPPFPEPITEEPTPEDQPLSVQPIEEPSETDDNVGDLDDPSQEQDPSKGKQLGKIKKEEDSVDTGPSEKPGKRTGQQVEESGKGANLIDGLPKGLHVALANVIRERNQALQNAIQVHLEKEAIIEQAGLTARNTITYNFDKLAENLGLALTFGEEEKEEKIKQLAEEDAAEEQAIGYIAEKEDLVLAIVEAPESEEEQVLKKVILDTPSLQRDTFKNVCKDTCFISTNLLSNYYEIVIEVDSGTLIEIEEIRFSSR